MLHQHIATFTVQSTAHVAYFAQSVVDHGRCGKQLPTVEDIINRQYKAFFERHVDIGGATGPEQNKEPVVAQSDQVAFPANTAQAQTVLGADIGVGRQGDQCAVGLMLA